MPDLLLDALPVIDLLEITASTTAVAELTQRDQSSVSRIYRQASDKLGLQFAKGPSGHYRAGSNQALLKELRRSSQRLRLTHRMELRWLGCSWSPALAHGTDACPPLPNRSSCLQRTCDLVRDHLLDLAVLPGRLLLPANAEELLPRQVVPLACGQLLALPLVRYRGPLLNQHQARPIATGPHEVEVLVLRRDLQSEPALMELVDAVAQAYRNAFRHRPDLDWLR